jgi:dTDP-4-dehydrorhamnose reductase
VWWKTPLKRKSIYKIIEVSSMKIIILGASGFLGSKAYSKLRMLQKYITYGTCFKHKQKNELITLDVIDDKEVEELFNRVNPDIVLWSLLNHDYSKEGELTHKGLINVIKHMKKSCKLIYITTDGFAEGRGNYSEEDHPSYFKSNNPINLYIKAKIEAEGIINKLDNYIIARTGPIYGIDALGKWDKRTAELIDNLSHGREIIRTSNLYKTFVNVDDFATALVEMIEIDFKGVIHVGPNMKESYYTYNLKMGKKFNLNTSLIKENCISKDEAKQHYISLDTSMNTSKCGKVLKTRFRSIDEFNI